MTAPFIRRFIAVRGRALAVSQRLDWFPLLLVRASLAESVATDSGYHAGADDRPERSPAGRAPRGDEPEWDVDQLEQIAFPASVGG